MLNEIDEVRFICRDGCRVFGTRESGYYKLSLCRVDADSSQRWLASRVGSRFEEASDQGYAFCVTVHYQHIEEQVRPKPKDVDWKSLQVDNFDVDAIFMPDLLRTRQDVGHLTGDFLMQLADWRPGPL